MDQVTQMLRSRMEDRRLARAARRAHWWRVAQVFALFAVGVWAIATLTQAVVGLVTR